MNHKDAMQTPVLSVSSFARKIYTLKPLPLKSLDQNRSRKLAEKITCLQWSET